MDTLSNIMYMIIQGTMSILLHIFSVTKNDFHKKFWSDMSTRPRMNHEVMNLEVILVLSSELSLEHFVSSSLSSASALHESRKKISFGLSLNTWQEKNIELKLSLAWIKKKIFIWSQPQYMTGKNIWLNLSLEWIGSFFRLWISVSA